VSAHSRVPGVAFARRMVWAIALTGLLVAAHAAELKPWTGGPPPPLTLKDLEGKTHRLADYKGKVVLINFWATWCAPCVQEMPSIQRLKDKLAGRPFVVLAVNLDEPGSLYPGGGVRMGRSPHGRAHFRVAAGEAVTAAQSS
jgi:thiol-disulfide isomerase/thioredoxin